MPSTSVLPPPPVREAMYVGGAMSVTWVSWFNQLFSRAGGAFAPTTNDLEVFGAYAEISNGVSAAIINNLQQQVIQNTLNIDALTDALAVQQNRIDDLEVINAYLPDWFYYGP
jgi:hypothetical protein